MAVQYIAGSRKKVGNGSYEPMIPFGVGGQYVNMLSGLTLERELKLGQDHQVSIVQNDDGSIDITETYQKPGDTKYYKVLTNINDEATTIVQKLYWVEGTGTETLKKTKTVSINQEEDGYSIQEVLS